MSRFCTEVLTGIGTYPVQTEMLLLYRLEKMYMFGMFIGVILKLIIASLFSLSVLMMYNMMMIGVEIRNFDFGMLRTVGLTRPRLVAAVLLDSLKFVALANLAAFPASLGCLRLAAGIFAQFFGFDYVLEPTFDAVLVASVVGFLVPIAASFVPIRVALGEKIIEAINPIRNKTVALTQEVYVEGREFPWGRFLFGSLAGGFGFMIVYLLPQGLIDQNVGLLLIIFFSLLIGLLVGLVMLAYSFHYLLERLVAYLTLFWLRRSDLALVLKNLSAHRIKNRRAALLYSLAVSFIVFVSVGISIQIQTIYNELLKQHSCYVEVTSSTASLNRPIYDQILASGNFSGQILGYSYETAPLSEYLRLNRGSQSVQISDKPRLFFLNDDVVGVSPEYLQSLYFSNFEVLSTAAPAGLDPVQYLYSWQGRGTAIVSEYMARKMSLDPRGSAEFVVTVNWATSARRARLNASTVMSKSAGLAFSAYMFMPSAVGVSLPTFAELANIQDYAELPYKK